MNTSCQAGRGLASTVACDKGPSASLSLCLRVSMYRMVCVHALPDMFPGRSLRIGARLSASLRAVNAAGASEWSPATVAATILSLPSPPLDVSVTPDAADSSDSSAAADARATLDPLSGAGLEQDAAPPPRGTMLPAGHVCMRVSFAPPQLTGLGASLDKDKREESGSHQHHDRQASPWWPLLYFELEQTSACPASACASSEPASSRALLRVIYSGKRGGPPACGALPVDRMEVSGEVWTQEGDTDVQRLEARVPARKGCSVTWRLRAVNAAGVGRFSERASRLVLALPSRVRRLRLQVLPVRPCLRTQARPAPFSLSEDSGAGVELGPEAWVGEVVMYDCWQAVVTWQAPEEEGAEGMTAEQTGLWYNLSFFTATQAGGAMDEAPQSLRVDASGSHLAWETPAGGGQWLGLGKAVWCSVRASNHAGAGAGAYVGPIAVSAPQCGSARVGFFGADTEEGDGARGRAGGGARGSGGRRGSTAVQALSRLVAGTEVGRVEVRWVTTQEAAGPEKIVLRLRGFNVSGAFLCGPVEIRAGGDDPGAGAGQRSGHWPGAAEVVRERYQVVDRRSGGVVVLDRWDSGLTQWFRSPSCTLGVIAHSRRDSMRSGSI